MPERKITAKSLMRRFSMNPHPENGSFVEEHYEYNGEGRADSGSIYYYVAPGERTDFHRIDCDEYWCCCCGAALDVWTIEPGGKLTVHNLGIDERCEPLLYLKKGTIFASRHAGMPEDGTFLICITVPRFTYAGFELFTQEEIISMLPETKAFFE